MNHVRKMLFGAAVALWAGLALAAEPPKSPVAVDIAKQPLREALAQFAQQTGLQVMLREEGLEAGKETAKSVRGKLAPREALEQLLEGTGLGYEFVTEKMIRISAARQTTRATEGEERIRMAQAGSAAGSADAAEGPASDEQKPGGVQLEEVVVTGTHIRGVVAAGSTLKVIRREEIERSGYSRVQDYFETLPQNFSGSAGEDVSTDSGATNFSRGQAVDLRGLGASSTLVLLNGKRQASGGLDASFVDISSIPLAFIDHIEVLSDGASALYGSDAIGGVVNFITRRDYDGFEASVRSGIISDAALEYGASLVGGRSWESGDIIAGYQFSRRDALEMADTPYGSQNKDFRKYGGDDLRVPGGAPGTIIDPFTFLPGFAIPAGQDGSSLTIDQLRPGQNNADNVTGNSALPRQIQHGLYFSTSYELSDSLRLVADGRFNHREMRLPSGDLTAFTIVPSTNPYFFDPYGLGAAFLWYSFSGLLGAPQIQFNNTNTLALSAGAEWKTGNEWRWNFFGSTARERNQWRTENSLDFIAIDSALNDTDPATALNLFGDPSFNDAATVDRLRLTSRGRGSSKVSSLSVGGMGAFSMRRQARSGWP